MKELFNDLLFIPLYNTLIFFIDIIPGGDVGFAVIILTLMVKFILFPLSKSAVRTSIKSREIQGELEEIKVKHKDSREDMGRAMLDLYKRNQINPFSGILLIFIQIPVILALYWVVYKGGLPIINTDILYSFISAPQNVDMTFLGVFHIAESKSITLALLAAVTQHIQARLSFPKQEKKEKLPTDKPDFKEDLMKGMQIQIKWVLPVMVFAFSYGLISVVALYWTISNLFAIGQEIYIRETIKKPAQKKTDELSSNITNL
jgi:YidC/Oxa1 family membrane protein insertase